MNYRRMYYFAVFQRSLSGWARRTRRRYLHVTLSRQPGSYRLEGIAHKAKGRGPFRDLAPHYPIFRRPGSVPRSQLIVTSELSGAFGRSPRFPYFPSFHSLQELSRAIRRSQFPECVESFVSDSLASLVPDALSKFLPRFPCEFRFRFSWSSFPGSLASSVTGSPDDSCLLSPTGGSLLR